MKLLAAISMTTLFLLLGTTAAGDTPQDRQEQGDKPQKQEEKTKPDKKEPQAKPAKQEQENKPAKQEAKPAKQETKPEKQETKQANQGDKDRPAKEEAKQAKQEQSGARVNQQDPQSAPGSRGGGDRNGGSHGRISDQHYRASFGSGHNFHVNRGDYDHRRFNYGGYSFGFIDPWPETWYYTDDVYAVYEGGGYYMYDAIHPGMRISVNIL